MAEIRRLAQTALPADAREASLQRVIRSRIPRRCWMPHSAKLLQHVDAGSPVGRVHHEMHRSISIEHPAQRAQSRIRVCKMMQNAGADDLIEAGLQLLHALDRKLGAARLSRRYFRFSSGVLRMLVALKSIPVTRAAGQRTHAWQPVRSRSPQSESNSPPYTVWRAKTDESRCVAVGVLPEPSILVEAVDGARIGIVFVEVVNLSPTCGVGTG